MSACRPPPCCPRPQGLRRAQFPPERGPLRHHLARLGAACHSFEAALGVLPRSACSLTAPVRVPDDAAEAVNMALEIDRGLPAGTAARSPARTQASCRTTSLGGQASTTAARPSESREAHTILGGDPASPWTIRRCATPTTWSPCAPAGTGRVRYP
ncbi:hypothetical protein QJS66_15080 [Kocuria rhizophila]|nr:hypothetical protein QJS66_15080 [Kocuria rhizophila]